MAVPSSVAEAYSQVEPALLALRRYVGATLRPWCESKDYLYRERVKGMDSVSEKIETGRYARWSELDDLFGCTVVIPTVTHEERVLAFLEEAFERVELRQRNSTAKAPDVFRFDWSRVICRVSGTAALELPPGTEGLLFEVQVPTVFARMERCYS